MILASNTILDKMGLIKNTLTEYLSPENKLLYLNIDDILKGNTYYGLENINRRVW